MENHNRDQQPKQPSGKYDILGDENIVRLIKSYFKIVVLCVFIGGLVGVTMSASALQRSKVVARLGVIESSKMFSLNEQMYKLRPYYDSVAWVNEILDGMTNFKLFIVYIKRLQLTGSAEEFIGHLKATNSKLSIADISPQVDLVSEVSYDVSFNVSDAAAGVQALEEYLNFNGQQFSRELANHINAKIDLKIIELNEKYQTGKNDPYTKKEIDRLKVIQSETVNALQGFVSYKFLNKDKISVTKLGNKRLHFLVLGLFLGAVVGLTLALLTELKRRRN